MLVGGLVRHALNYGGAPSAQGSRALDRGRDAISEVGRQSIAGSSAGNRTVPSKKTPRGECPTAALSPSRVTDEANFGWRCWRRGCPRTRCGSGAGGVAQIAPGFDAFTRHTGLQRQQDPLVKSPPWCQSLLVESSFGMRSPVFTQLGPLADTSTRLAEARFETKAEIEPPAWAPPCRRILMDHGLTGQSACTL